MYTITLNDGTKLENLELNGNNYISDSVIDASIFEENLESVSISDGEKTENFSDMKLMSLRVDKDGRSWIVLGEKTQYEKAMEHLNMMADTSANSITDIQVALAEVYEMILGGM